MRWRSLGVLALILALLAGVYYVLEAKGKKSEGEANQLFRVDEKEIEKISIGRKGEQVVLRRDGDAWLMIEPVQAKADNAETASLLNTITSARSERTINEEPKSLGEYGLDRPAIKLTVSLKGDKRLSNLLLGDKNPNGFSVYAKREDKPPVFLVADSLRSRLDRNATDLRDKTLLHLEPDKVKRLELSGKGRSISLSNAGTDQWEMVQPIKAKADASAVRDLLWKIRNARVKEFLSSDTDTTRRYGLDRPDLIVALTQDGASKRLLLKEASDPTVGLYALADPGQGVVIIDGRLLTDLSKSPFDLRDRSLLRFETSDVKAIQLRRDGQSLALAKDGDLWKLTTPTSADAQAGKVYDLLYALKELRYHALVENDGSHLARYGLTSPQAEVELTMADGSHLPALLFGKAERDRLYAKVATDPAVYAIDPKFLGRIPNGPDALKQETRPVAGK
jgi:cbb3-type cytochrome oxidase subunit 3